MQARLKHALSKLPTDLQQAITPLLDPNFSASFSATNVNQLKQATSLDDKALQLALLPLAAAFSVAPISNFYVGAIAKGVSGNLYLGANFEFAGKGLFHSIHAEQSAISNAWANNETQLLDITVTATPCGHCRQFMNELTSADHLSILLPDDESQLHAFLPHAFGPKDLGITDGLMTPSAHGLNCGSQDPLILAALDAANQSYAPYSKGYAAVALEFNDGTIYCGRYAENAAFNPSLPPMQMACAQAILNQREFSDLKRAVLVENKAALISQVDSAQAALGALSDLVLEVVEAF